MALPRKTFTAAELTPGQTYRVVFPFADYDGILHPVGEHWRFVEKHFLPYEDGLTLVVENEGQQRWIRLQWRQESQGQVIDLFSDYVEAV